MSRISDALARASKGASPQPDGVGAPAGSMEVLPQADAFGIGAQPEFPIEDVVRTAPNDVAPSVDEPVRTTMEFPARLAADAIEKLVVGGMAAASIEQYRRLAAVLHQAHMTTGLRLVMIASAVAGEGKTLTSANLALTLSESYRRRVLLIDADLRRPYIHTLFGLPNLDGLTDALSAPEERRICTQPVTSLLSVVTAGRPDSEQMAHLTSSRMRRVLEEAKQVHDWVIIDTPPVALLSDAKLLAGMVDGTLLVVRAGATPYPIVQRAMQAIGPERILGTILNGAEASAVTGHGYYEGYYAYETPRRQTSRWPWRRRQREEGDLLRQPAGVPGSAASE